MENIHNRCIKKALIIAYSFPPLGGGRVRRVMKFVKFLPEFGWEPIVLTVKKPIGQNCDYSLLNEIPNSIKIIRTNSLELAFLAGYANKHKLALINRKGLLGKIKSGIFRIVGKLKWWICFPDSRNGWIPFCVFHGQRIIKSEKIDLIYVNGEPYSSFVSGILLKRLTGRPLVLDFRDEWTEFYNYYFPGKPRLIGRLERIAERIAVKSADKVISVTQPIIDSFISRYKKEKKEKFICVTNGFDPDDFNGLSCLPKEDGKFTIVYTGILYRERSPGYFLDAVKRVIEIEPEFLSKAKIVLAGTYDDTVANLLNKHGELNGMIKTVGFLPHREALRIMMEADLLLYIEEQAPDSNRLLPAKLFEYIAAKKPILALSNGGPVKEIMEDIGCGKVVQSFDIEGIANNLSYFYDRFKKNEPVPRGTNNIGRLAEFSRKNLTLKLSVIFNGVLEKE